MRSLFRTFFTLVIFVISMAGIGCSTGGGEIDVSVLLPTWINAVWSGGAVGAPTDRTDQEATDFSGTMCPASAIQLTNQDEGAGLTIINNCSLTVTLGLCVAKGSLPQPVNGMNECATDPFDTDFTQLTLVPLDPGPLGFFINATENLDVNVFFCSDSQNLVGPPLQSQIGCL